MKYLKFYIQVLKENRIEDLKSIHDFLKNLIDSGDFKSVNDYLTSIYSEVDVDISQARIALILTKNLPQFNRIRNKIIEAMEKKLGKKIY